VELVEFFVCVDTVASEINHYDVLMIEAEERCQGVCVVDFLFLSEIKQTLSEVAKLLAWMCSDGSLVNSNFVWQVLDVAFISIIKVSAFVIKSGTVLLFDLIDELALGESLGQKLSNLFCAYSAEEFVFFLCGDSITLSNCYSCLGFFNARIKLRYDIREIFL
jgi:hypothetical protein